jgi:hypothetical protein
MFGRPLRDMRESCADEWPTRHRNANAVLLGPRRKPEGNDDARLPTRTCPRASHHERVQEEGDLRSRERPETRVGVVGRKRRRRRSTRRLRVGARGEEEENPARRVHEGRPRQDPGLRVRGRPLSSAARRRGRHRRARDRHGEGQGRSRDAREGFSDRGRAHGWVRG